jgi:hypothetical protein
VIRAAGAAGCSIVENMIGSRLIARRVNNDPPGYRVIFEGVKIGSISKQTRHVHPIETYALGHRHDGADCRSDA